MTVSGCSPVRSPAVPQPLGQRRGDHVGDARSVGRRPRGSRSWYRFGVRRPPAMRCGSAWCAGSRCSVRAEAAGAAPPGDARPWHGGRRRWHRVATDEADRDLFVVAGAVALALGPRQPDPVREADLLLDERRVDPVRCEHRQRVLRRRHGSWALDCAFIDTPEGRPLGGLEPPALRRRRLRR